MIFTSESCIIVYETVRNGNEDAECGAFCREKSFLNGICRPHCRNGAVPRHEIWERILGMDEQTLNALIRDAVNDADLLPEEIPAIDLYLDQITCLASDKLREGSPRFYDRALTKTMVNNYSKDGLISPIKGKKYTKEHFLQMLLVYAMKSTLSIGEIKRILQNLYRVEGFDADMLTDIYRRYLEIKQYERKNACRVMKVILRSAGLDLEKEEDFAVLLLGLSSISSYLKTIVQALLEEHYPDLNEEKEREEKERREASKRQKEEKKTGKTKKQEEPNGPDADPAE